MTRQSRRAQVARYLLAGSALTAPVILVPAAGAQSSQNGQGTVVQQGWDPQQILRTETYVKPPAVIERIVMAPRTDISFTNPSPDHKWFLRTPGFDRGDIDKFGAAHVNLSLIHI